MSNTPDNTPEMKQTVSELKNAFTLVDVKVLEDSTKKYESRVMRPATGWLGRATAIKNQVAEFHEEKLVYDHYTRKVMALREARDKRSAAGKNEKPKDVEKLVRNEQKLAASTNAYSKLSDSTVASLRDFVNTREATLAPIIQRVLEFRVQYAGRIADESHVFQKMVRQDSAFDTVLGALESFAAQFSSSGGSGGGASNSASAPPPSSSTATPAMLDVPVKALSFECFVGEASPPPPGAATAMTSNEWQPPDMPPLPTPPQRDTSSSRGLASPTSPSSANPFLGSSMTSPTSSPHGGVAAVGFQTAPLTPTSASNFTPWDEIPPPPPPQDGKTAFGGSPFTAMQFNTMPASPTAPPASFDWDTFDNMGDFQKMHQQNAMP
jgi:hypothetical protein